MPPDCTLIRVVLFANAIASTIIAFCLRAASAGAVPVASANSVARARSFGAARLASAPSSTIVAADAQGLASIASRSSGRIVLFIIVSGKYRDAKGLCEAALLLTAF